MKELLLLFLVFSATFINAQSSFIDSVFWNIPVDMNVRSTIYLLNNDHRFKIRQIDTVRDISDPKTEGDYVAYKALVKSYIPNSAADVTYRKYSSTLSFDDEPAANCLQWMSDIVFTYKKTARAKKQFETIASFFSIRQNTKTTFVLSRTGDIKANKFCLTEDNFCKIIAVEIDEEHRTVTVSYR